MSLYMQVARFLLVVGSLAVYWNAYGVGVNLSVGPPTQVPQPDAQQFTQRFYPECVGPDRVNLTKEIMSRMAFPTYVFSPTILTYKQGCSYWYWSYVNVETNPWWVGWTLAGVILGVVGCIGVYLPTMVWSSDHANRLVALCVQSFTVFWAWIAWYGYSRAQDLERCVPLELQDFNADGGNDDYVASILSGAFLMLTNSVDYDWASNVVLKQCSNLLLVLAGPDAKLILPLTSSDRVQAATHDAVMLFQNCCWAITAAWVVLAVLHLCDESKCCVRLIQCCCCGARCEDHGGRRRCCIDSLDCCCCRLVWNDAATRLPLLQGDQSTTSQPTAPQAKYTNFAPQQQSTSASAAASA